MRYISTLAPCCEDLSRSRKQRFSVCLRPSLHVRPSALQTRLEPRRSFDSTRLDEPSLSPSTLTRALSTLHAAPLIRTFSLVTVFLSCPPLHSFGYSSRTPVRSRRAHSDKISVAPLPPILPSLSYRRLFSTSRRCCRRLRARRAT